MCVRHASAAGTLFTTALLCVLLLLSAFRQPHPKIYPLFLLPEVSGIVNSITCGCKQYDVVLCIRHVVLQNFTQHSSMSRKQFLLTFEDPDFSLKCTFIYPNYVLLSATSPQSSTTSNPQERGKCEACYICINEQCSSEEVFS